MRVVPLSLARGYGRVASKSKRYAVLFLLIAFVVIPIVGLILSEIFMRLA